MDNNTMESGDSNSANNGVQNIEHKEDDSLDSGDKSRDGRAHALPSAGLLHSHSDAEDYNMNLESLGRVVIFNHYKFDPHLKLPDRNGTHHDRDQLLAMFKKIGFTEIEVYDDLTLFQVENVLKRVQHDDHTKRSSLIICLLSHGDDGVLYARDSKYPKNDLWEKFLGDQCPSLATKPKIFFIQACQGDKLDAGVDVISTVKSDSGTQTYRIPTYADMLIVSSTVPGYYSWRNTSQGSWFMQCLCSVISEHWQNLDLLSMLTKVNRQVAYYFHSNTPSSAHMHNKKQVPYVTSTLTRRVFLQRNLQVSFVPVVQTSHTIE